jgi:hypothetical protein
MRTPVGALTETISTLQNVQREHGELEATVQDLSVELRATCAVLDEARLEIAQLKNDLSIAIRAEHEAYRECDRIRKDLEIVRGVVFPYETMPTPKSARSRKAKNGEPVEQPPKPEPQPNAGQNEEVETRPEDSIPKPTERD